MSYAAQLEKSVADAIASERIGSPVFLRWTAATAEDGEDGEALDALLLGMAAQASRWLGAGVARLYASGPQPQQHISLALTFTNGGSALLAAARGHNRPHASFALYGNRGAIYHSDFLFPLRDGPLAPAPPPASGEMARLSAALAQSLRSGQPVLLPPVGGIE